jgi:hypothetical protein
MFWDNLLIVTALLILMLGFILLGEFLHRVFENFDSHKAQKRNQKERKRIGLS